MVSAVLNEAPSKIIRTVLIAGNMGTLPTASDLWPIYIVNEPDEPDNCITIFDTAPVFKGRHQVGGAYCRRPGFNIRVRCNQYEPGWLRADQLAIYLAESDTGFTPNTIVTVDDESYKVHEFSITSGPFYVGKSLPDSKRYIFSINGTMGVTQQ